MAGTYDYFKVASMKFMDSSSSLIIDSSSAVCLKTASLTANSLVSDTFTWNNAYVADTSYNETRFPFNGNIVVDSFDVYGNLDASSVVVTGNLQTGTFNASNISGNIINANIANTDNATVLSGTITGNRILVSLDISGDLDISGNAVAQANVLISQDGTIKGNLESVDVVFNTLTSTGLTVDTSSNTSFLNNLNVTGNVTLDDLYVQTNTTVAGNVNIEQNLAVIQNKSVLNSLYVSNEFQMWDGSGFEDPSGFVVSLNGTQLLALLALI
jgi:cytoskeletal protein CcmA (bactofilin family)